MHIIALDSDDSPKTLLEITRTFNVSNSQLVKSFLQEHPFLFRIQGHNKKRNMILVYSASSPLRNFFLDPGRSRHLYPMPWIIDKCWEAIECALKMRHPSHSSWTLSRLQYFFAGPASQDCQISGASLMLLAASIRNGLDDDNLLCFLGFLSRIPWDSCFSDYQSEACTLAIAQCVCKTLVG
jgi:hypothetical protein